MKRLVCDIKIGKYSFSYVHSVEITSSWDLFTDTCAITLPLKLTKNGKRIYAAEGNIFNKGDAVKVQIGYFPNMNTVFEGFVSRITPDINVLIECQDVMWKLKQVNFTKTLEYPTLKELIAYLCKDQDIENEVGIETKLGKFVLKNVNGVQVLDELKSKYGIVSWARGGKIYSGLKYYPNNAIEKKFSFQYNIISSNLEYRKDGDVPTGVKAVSFINNNTKIEEIVGDPKGDLITLNYYGLSKEDLKKTAEREYKKYIYTGYYGNFTAFGEPYVRHGDYVTIVDNRLPERTGTYVVKSVKYYFGVDGYRQDVELETKITS